MVKKKIVSKKSSKTTIVSIEDRATIMKKIVDDAQKNRFITYESIMEHADRYKFNEEETNQLLKDLERRNVDLIMQEELQVGDQAEDFFELDEKAPAKIVKKLDTAVIEEGEEEIEDADDEDKDESEVVKELPEIPQIADGVKCYLRDIGKIPLLNKKTESIIAEKIASGKENRLKHYLDFLLFTKKF